MANLTWAFPLGNKTKLTVGGNFTNINNDYYENPNAELPANSTADQTGLMPICLFRYEMNSLNEKEYANSGHRIMFQSEFVDGKEDFDTGKFRSLANQISG